MNSFRSSIIISLTSLVLTSCDARHRIKNPEILKTKPYVKALENGNLASLDTNEKGKSHVLVYLGADTYLEGINENNDNILSGKEVRKYNSFRKLKVTEEDYKTINDIFSRYWYEREARDKKH